MSRIITRASDLPKRSLWQKIRDVGLTDVAVLAKGGVSKGSLEALEQLLIEADFGVETTMRLVAEVEGQASRGFVKTEAQFLEALRAGVEKVLRDGRSDPALAVSADKPTVILVVGVNGAGKTTFIGKLSQLYRLQGKRVLVAAGDTFRAGAIHQLQLWAERTGAEFVGSRPGGDPAAVAYAALDAALTRGSDVVIVDTAGRLHTSTDLMSELQKVAKVIAKRLPGAPHETLLVLDATIGQNAVAQAKTFASAVGVTGLVMTKVDGSAKGGIVVAVHRALDVPIKFLGTGEGASDIEPFDASSFSRELLGT
jgi:fused signal recognition particle receptor